MAKTADVVVIGGGVIGCAIAYELVKSGLSVVLLERGAIGGEASSASAGLLVPLNVLERDEPEELFRLAWAGLKLFEDWLPEVEEATGIRVEYEPCGVLRVAVGEEEEALLKEKCQKWLTEIPGVSLTPLTERELKEMEPNLSPEARWGFFSPQEAQVNPDRLTQALAAAAAKFGAQVRCGCPAIGIRHTNRKIESVLTPQGEIATKNLVIAAGAWSRTCAEWFEVSIPVTAVKGQMLSLRPPRRLVHHPIFAAGHGGLFPKPDGSVHVGATIEPEVFDKSNTAEGVAWLLSIPAKFVPELSKAPIERMWSGLRPFCQDYLPVIGSLPGWEGVTFATGHYRMGIVCSPVTANLLRQGILDGLWDEMAKLFSPARFSSQ